MSKGFHFSQWFLEFAEKLTLRKIERFSLHTPA